MSDTETSGRSDARFGEEKAVQREASRQRVTGDPTGSDAHTKRRICEAALQLFARYGYDGVSLQRIAQEVGLHKSSVFHHYRYKVDLACDVFADAVEQLVARVRPLAKEDPPTVEGALQVVDAVVDHLYTRPQVARVIMSFLSAPEGSDLHLRMRADRDHPVFEFFSILTAWLTRAKEAGVIRHVNTTEMVFNLIGVILFYPTAAESHWAMRPDPFSQRARKTHKEELHELLLGAFLPRNGAAAAR